MYYALARLQRCDVRTNIFANIARLQTQGCMFAYARIFAVTCTFANVRFTLCLHARLAALSLSLTLTLTLPNPDPHPNPNPTCNPNPNPNPTCDPNPNPCPYLTLTNYP
jgi:hypothetical protein